MAEAGLNPAYRAGISRDFDRCRRIECPALDSPGRTQPFGHIGVTEAHALSAIVADPEEFR
jgi:hypothetical protein